jgi:hypothetical protein
MRNGACHSDEEVRFFVVEGSQNTSARATCVEYIRRVVVLYGSVVRRQVHALEIYMLLILMS